MRLSIGRQSLARVLGAVSKVIESRNTIPILSHLMLSAGSGRLHVTGTDLDITATASAEADINGDGSVCVDAKLLGSIVAKAGADDMAISLEDDKLTVKSGRSRFSLATLPAADFPTLSDGKYDATFELDIAALFAPVQFAISNEEVRYFLNGVFFKGGDSVAVATDGHRLARNNGPAIPEFEGIIVPRKAVSLLPKGAVTVSVSDNKIRIEAGDFVLTSKLIDGTFPDYTRVIPMQNSNVVSVDRDAMMKAAERVVTVSSEKARAVKLSIAPGSVSLSARSDVGTAEDEVPTDYSGEPLFIGFNAAYLRDMLAVLPSGPVTLQIADAGSPARVLGVAEGWDGVLMPYRVA